MPRICRKPKFLVRSRSSSARAVIMPEHRPINCYELHRGCGIDACVFVSMRAVDEDQPGFAVVFDQSNVAESPKSCVIRRAELDIDGRHCLNHKPGDVF